MIRDLKYLMSYTIAITAFIGIVAGGPFVYLTVIYTFIFIPILEINIKQDNQIYSIDEKKKRNLNLFFDFLLYMNVTIVYTIFFICLKTLLLSNSFFEIIGILQSSRIIMATNGINVEHEIGQSKSLFSKKCKK